MSDGFYYKDTNGQEHNIYPICNAHISDCGTKYLAPAESIDNDNRTWEFILCWQIKDGIDINNVDDQADACNWDEYQVEELGEAL